jgi:hypothetical protein
MLANDEERRAIGLGEQLKKLRKQREKNRSK